MDSGRTDACEFLFVQPSLSQRQAAVLVVIRTPSINNRTSTRSRSPDRVVGRGQPLCGSASLADAAVQDCLSGSRTLLRLCLLRIPAAAQRRSYSSLSLPRQHIILGIVWSRGWPPPPAAHAATFSCLAHPYLRTVAGSCCDWRRSTCAASRPEVPLAPMHGAEASLRTTSR